MRRWLFIGLGVVLLLGLGVLLVLPRLVDLPRVRQLIAQEATKALGRPVRFEKLSLSFFPLPAVAINALTVSEDPRFGPTPFVTAEEVRLRIRLLKLFSGQIELGEISLSRPSIHLVQDPSGRMNLFTLGTTSSIQSGQRKGREGARGAGATTLAISEIKVKDGVVGFETLDRAGRSTGHYEISGLSLTANGFGSRAVTLKGQGTLTPGEAAVRLNAEVGPVGGNGLAQAEVKGQLSVEIKDLGPLSTYALDGHPVLGGGARGALSLSGSLAKLQATGQIESAGVTAKDRPQGCPSPEPRSLTLEQLRVPLSVFPDRAVARPLAFKLAGGNVSFALTLDWDPALTLALREISVEKVALAPILSGYLCQAYAVNAPLDLRGELHGPLTGAGFLKQLNGRGEVKIGAGTVTGPAALSVIGGLVQIGGAVSSALRADVPRALLSSPINFDQISATYTITNGVLTTKDLLYQSHQLRIRGAGKYQLAEQQLNFDVVAETGGRPITAKVVGSAASPSVRLSSTTVIKDVEDAARKFLKGLQIR